MGYRAPAGVKDNEEGRQLPIFNILGTDFIVDIKAGEFRQAGNQKNRIIMNGVKETYGFGFFYYDTRAKNVFAGPAVNLPAYVALVIVPPLKELDPIGLARRQGLPDEFYTAKKQAGIREQLPQLIRNQNHEDSTAVRKSQKI